jgi:hypothetical protein
MIWLFTGYARKALSLGFVGYLAILLDCILARRVLWIVWQMSLALGKLVTVITVFAVYAVDRDSAIRAPIAEISVVTTIVCRAVVSRCCNDKLTAK